MKHRKRQKVDPDKDLDGDVDEYDPSDSDDGFDKEDKIMLERAKKGRLIDDEREEEVFRVHSSSEEDKEEEEEDDDEDSEDSEEGGDDGKGFYGGGVGSDMDSDIEGQGGEDEEDGLPDSKAWGDKKSRYYNTDYVDKDFGGFSKDEEEVALMEEKEADAIQRRLMAQLEETDFSLGLLDKVEEKKAEIARKAELSADSGEKISTDFTKLSKEEKIQFLKQDSPEFFPLINDFKERLTFARDKIEPILKLVEDGEIPDCKIVSALRLQYQIILNYCTNITFYLMLKSKRVRVESHPVVKRLFTYRKLLQELDGVNGEVIAPQVDAILDIKARGLPLEIVREEEVEEAQPKNRAERRKKQFKFVEEERKLAKVVERKKRKLSARDRFEEEEITREEAAKLSDSDVSDEEEMEQQGEEGEEDNYEGDENDKRAITWQMQKNKGLTPRRKREQRNPRVKNRNKYKKAKIRRKGQVREVRKEVDRYGGEISGIKAYVSKSVKFK